MSVKGRSSSTKLTYFKLGVVASYIAMMRMVWIGAHAISMASPATGRRYYRAYGKKEDIDADGEMIYNKRWANERNSTVLPTEELPIRSIKRDTRSLPYIPVGRTCFATLTGVGRGPVS